MNEEVKQLFEQFSSVVAGLEDKLNKILDAYSEAEADYNDTVELNDWETNHGEKLHKYDAELKALNGDDFDVIKAARDEYKADFADTDEDEYVDNLVSHIEESIGNLKEALVAEKEAETPEEKEEAKEDVQEAAAEVNETVEEATQPENVEENAETESTEPAPETETPEEVNQELPETETEDEADAFEKELLAEAEKAKKQYGQD